MKTVSSPIWTGHPSIVGKSDRSYLETGVRGLIKACYATIEVKREGIPQGYFGNYKALIDFIHSYEAAR